MAKTTLNAKNLEALGAQRLAELLIEISTGSAAHKRRLRIALAGSQSISEVAREVRKRLGSIARSRTFIGWRKVKSVKTDLETQRKAIVDVIGPEDPREAFELIWQFLSIADSIFERSDAGTDTLIDSFYQASADASRLAQLADIEPDLLADKVFWAIKNNDHGQFDPIVSEMALQLGSAGLAHLKQRLLEWLSEPAERPSSGRRKLAYMEADGPVYEDDILHKQRGESIRLVLREIADLEGDVDAYIAQQPEEARKVPSIAADIAERLLANGRVQEALKILDEAEHGRLRDASFEWQRARIDVIEALGRHEEAQTWRWTYFEQSLDDRHLRAFLKRLPDFDDVEAEERAFKHVREHPDVHEALEFFLRWPALAEAARLILSRRTELDGDLYELMTPAADTLAEKHPLAATIVLRSMIDFTLDRARSSRYKHAARHLAECASLAGRITERAELPPHDAYVAKLKRDHGRKTGFWSLV